MTTPRALIENLAKAPMGATFELPLFFSEPITEKDKSGIQNLIIQKNVKQIKLTGMTELRKFHFRQYSSHLPSVLKWIFSLPVAKVIFEFNDIDLLDPHNAQFMKNITFECIAPCYQGENLPLLACLAKSPIDEVIDEDNFALISLGKHSSKYEGSRVIMHRLYDLQFVQRLIGLGEKHALAQRKNHAHACYKAGIKRYDLLRQFVADNADSGDYPDKLITELDCDLEKLAYRIGMNFMMLDANNSEFLFQAIHFFSDLLSEDNELDDNSVEENIANCIAILLDIAKKLEAQGQITAAYAIHRRLLYTNTILKTQTYNYHLFLLNNYDNPELLKLINKSVKSLLGELIQKFSQFSRKEKSEEITKALETAKQLLNRYKEATNPGEPRVFFKAASNSATTEDAATVKSSSINTSPLLS